MTIKLTFIAAGLVVFIATTSADAQATHPIKQSAADVRGILNRPDAVKANRDGHASVNVTTFTSPDSKFLTGMYTAEASRFEVKAPEGYPVDEFMYFIDGGVTLTSSDGVITEVKSGEGVTLPKGWTGVWDSKGYSKFYVIYAPGPKP